MFFTSHCDWVGIVEHQNDVARQVITRWVHSIKVEKELGEKYSHGMWAICLIFFERWCKRAVIIRAVACSGGKVVNIN